MAKEAKKTGEVVPLTGSQRGIAQVSSELDQEFEGAYGGGMSDRAEDRGTPLIYIAQSMSRQVDKQQPEYIEGLEVGMAFNNLTGQKWDALGRGMPFLPVLFKASLVEWTPREAGGGFHGEHPFMTPEEVSENWEGVKQYTDPKTGSERRDIWELPNGHELILTHYYLGILPDDLSAAYIPMSSTNLGASQRMQAIIANTRMKNSRGAIVVPPAWVLPWQMKTVYKTNDQGKWYKWSPIRLGDINQPETYTDPDLRSVCRQLYDAALAGGVRMSKPLDQGTSTSGGVVDDGSDPLA